MSLKSGACIAIVGILTLLGSQLVTCAVEAGAAPDEPMVCDMHADASAKAPAMPDCCALAGGHAHPLGVSQAELVRDGGVPLLRMHHPEAGSYVRLATVDRPVHLPLTPPDTGPPDCLAFSVLLI